MSQYDFGAINPATKTGTELAADLTAWRTALNSGHKGASRPAYAIAGTTWIDDSASTWLVKTYDGTDDVIRAAIDPATHELITPLPEFGAWTDVSSASTVDLGAQASRNLRITGTTTITSFGTTAATDNIPYKIRFAASLTLTNGSSLILPGGANIVTDANDVIEVVHDTTSIWRVVDYTKTAVPPLGGPLSQAIWSAGTSTAEAPLSPAKLAGALAVLASGGGLKGVTFLGTANTSFTTASGTKYIVGVIKGGGGGGGAGNVGNTGSGGGSGAFGIFIASVSGSSTYPVVIGAGGTAGISEATNGGSGGATGITIGATTYSVSGGGGGGIGANAPGAGGSVSDVCLLGFPGNPGQQGSTVAGAKAGGSDVWRILNGIYGMGGASSATPGSGNGVVGGAGVMVLLQLG